MKQQASVPTRCPLCQGKGFIEEDFENFTGWLAGEEEPPYFLKKKGKNERNVRKGTIPYSGYNEKDLENVTGWLKQEKETTLLTKEKGNNERNVRNGTIPYSGYNEKDLGNVTEWLKQEKETRLMTIEKEKNERNVRNGTIPYSGYEEKDSENATGWMTQEKERPLMTKEKEKNERNLSKSTIPYSGYNEKESENATGWLTQEEETPVLLKEEEKIVKNVQKSTIYDSVESLQLPALVKQHQPQQGVKKFQSIKQSATNQDITQHDNVTTDSPTARHTSVPKKPVLPGTEYPRSTSVPIVSKQKGSSITVKHSADVKKVVSPETYKAMKLAMSKLEDTKLDTAVEGMQDIRQILRCNSALVEEHMVAIYNILSTLVTNQRLKVAWTACQTAKEIFQTVQCTVRVGLQAIVSSLLQRASGDKTFIGQVANEALDSMVMNTPPSQVLKIFTSCGIRHKYALVSATVARLLMMVVTTSGADRVLSPTANKAYKERVLSAAATFLGDKNLEARHHAQDLLKFLMTEYEDFELQFVHHIDWKTWKGIEKKIAAVRAEVNKRPRHYSRK